MASFGLEDMAQYRNCLRQESFCGMLRNVKPGHKAMEKGRWLDVGYSLKIGQENFSSEDCDGLFCCTCLRMDASGWLCFLHGVKNDRES